MRNAPTNWNTLMASPLHKTETKVVINGVSYYGFDGESGIFSLETSHSLYESMSVGNCPSATINMVLVRPQAIPRMAKIEVYVRLVESNIETEWVRKGVFFIDTREWDYDHTMLTITGYDAMLKGETPYLIESTGTGEELDTVAVGKICTILGVELDSRTVLNKQYKIQVKTLSSDEGESTTARETLGWIGAMYGGNWIITDDGNLRLVPLKPTSTISVGNNLKDIITSPAYDAIGTIHLVVDSEHEYTAGTGGYEIEIECPWGTQAIANNLLTALRGYVYEPYEADVVFIANPLWELGDGVSVGDSTTSVISRSKRFFSLSYTESLSAPSMGELEHEYPFESKEERIARKAADSVAKIVVDMDSINLSVDYVDGQTKFTLKKGTAELSAETVDLHVKALNIDGTINANKLNLTGSISWGDLSNSCKNTIEAMSGDENPVYIKSTYIDATSVSAPLIRANNFDIIVGQNAHSGSYRIFPASQQENPAFDITWYDDTVYTSPTTVISAPWGGDMSIMPTRLMLTNVNAMRLLPGMYGTSDPSGTATNGTLYFKI